MPTSRRSDEEDPRLPPVAGVQSTLTGEHALLLAAVTARASAVLDGADDDRWPQEDLQELLDYLHLEVLRQIVDEEWLLFRNRHNDAEQVAKLYRDHVQLRSQIEVLADAAGTLDRPTPSHLAVLTRDLLSALQDHIGAEDHVLSSDSSPPSTSALGRTPHAWYELTDGPVIDLDALPGPRGIDAVLGRALRLRRGEVVELQASSDPLPIWRQLAGRDPGGYGFDYLQQGPPEWRVRITRRATS